MARGRPGPGCKGLLQPPPSKCNCLMSTHQTTKLQRLTCSSQSRMSCHPSSPALACGAPCRADGKPPLLQDTKRLRLIAPSRSQQEHSCGIGDQSCGGLFRGANLHICSIGAGSRPRCGWIKEAHSIRQSACLALLTQLGAIACKLNPITVP